MATTGDDQTIKIKCGSTFEMGHPDIRGIHTYCLRHRTNWDICQCHRTFPQLGGSSNINVVRIQILSRGGANGFDWPEDSNIP